MKNQILSYTQRLAKIVLLSSETNYSDHRYFLAAGNVSCDNWKYLITIIEDGELKSESFRVEVQTHGSLIIAGEVDCVRPGIFYLEDEMLRKRALIYSVCDELKNICQIKPAHYRSQEGSVFKVISGLIPIAIYLENPH